MKPLSSPSIKKLNHTRSTPDLSSIISANKKDEEDTSSSLENLSKTYSTINSSQPRPTGSILKRKPQPKQIHEEPIYVSSASVPLQQSTIRSVQSMIHDQNTHLPERYFGYKAKHGMTCCTSDCSLPLFAVQFFFNFFSFHWILICLFF